MKKVVRKFNSHKEAYAADRQFYLSLTPEQRLDILFEIVATHEEGLDEAQKGFQRVYRIVKLGER